MRDHVPKPIHTCKLDCLTHSRMPHRALYPGRSCQTSVFLARKMPSTSDVQNAREIRAISASLILIQHIQNTRLQVKRVPTALWMPSRSFPLPLSLSLPLSAPVSRQLVPCCPHARGPKYFQALPVIIPLAFQSGGRELDSIDWALDFHGCTSNSSEYRYMCN